jgi:hypothetical protein
MKKLFIVSAVAMCLPLNLAGQDVAKQLEGFVRALPGTELRLNLVHLNDRTVPLFFQPPLLYSIRARAKEVTSLYVQGVAERSAELDTTNFSIEQNNESSTAMPTSIHNFTSGRLKLNKGDHVDGVLTFTKRFDVSRPFTVKHGRDTVDFSFTPKQVEEMTPPSAAR